jgi:hypothetical protein
MPRTTYKVIALLSQTTGKRYYGAVAPWDACGHKHRTRVAAEVCGAETFKLPLLRKRVLVRATSKTRAYWRET